MYKKASLVGFLFDLQCFYSSHKMNIIKDPEFVDANAVYQAEFSQLKREGTPLTQHKPPINSVDMKTLNESGLLSLIRPETLQNKVFFEVTLFFLQKWPPESQRVGEGRLPYRN